VAAALVTAAAVVRGVSRAQGIATSGLPRLPSARDLGWIRG
jgi:hypothetical protein